MTLHGSPERRAGAGAELLEAIEDVAAVDHHAHDVVREVGDLDAFRGLFSESPDPRQWPHVATTLTYRRALGELAELWGCEPTEAAVFARRAGGDAAEYASALMSAAHMGVLLVDDGYPPPGTGWGLERLAEFSGARVWPVMRLERVAEEGLQRVRGNVPAPLDALRDHVRAAVRSARAGGYAGLKTIAAYRTGLDVGPPRPRDAARELDELRRFGTVRLQHKALLELLLWDALEINAVDPLPVQVHCGFGDPDLLLARADPSYLKPLIEAFPDTPIVLLHCYPFVRHAGWLAHVYPNVYFDVSLTIPHVARPAEMLRQALELAPVSKLLYASDAARAPELYYLAARWWREALAEVLSEALPLTEAEDAAVAILRNNALGLYPIA